jgi:hypothetical protein
LLLRTGKASGNDLVDATSPPVGDKFVLQGIVWTVLEIKKNGIECKPDPAFFFYPQG